MNPTVDKPTTEESIFEVSNFELKKYQRHVSNARRALFVTAGVLVLGGILASFRLEGEILLDIWIEVLVVAGCFVVLAMIAEKKPYGALIAGLIIYILYILLYFLIDPATIFRGLILKIIIIAYLVKGIVNAGEIKDIKKVMGNEE